MNLQKFIILIILLILFYLAQFRIDIRSRDLFACMVVLNIYYILNDYVNCNVVEGFLEQSTISNEAVQNIAAMIEKGNLSVGDFTVNGKLTVNGITALKEDTSIQKNLSVDGATIIKGRNSNYSNDGQEYGLVVNNPIKTDSFISLLGDTSIKKTIKQGGFGTLKSVNISFPSDHTLNANGKLVETFG